MDEKELFDLFFSKQISAAKFIETYFTDISPSDEYILAKITNAITNKDRIAIEESISILHSGQFTQAKLTEKLCEILAYPWHMEHEEIASMLQSLADPKTVDSLYQASKLQFDYLDYDDTYQFARKCIKAMAQINDANAINKLWLLADHDIVEISNYAKKELRYKGLLLPENPVADKTIATQKKEGKRRLLITIAVCVAVIFIAILYYLV